MNTTPRRAALVVDDQRFNRVILRHTLDSLLFDTTEAANGDEALRLLDARTFDVVFLDWELPGASKGDRVAREIRSIPRHNRTLLIAITTDTSDAMRRRCADVGTDAFLGKAFDATNVQAALNIAAQKHARTGTARAFPSTDEAGHSDKIASGVHLKLASYAHFFPGGLAAALDDCRAELTLERQRLHTARAIAAWAHAARAAHNIRSLAAMLALDEVHEAAIAAENALRACDDFAAQGPIARLDALLDRTCQALTPDKTR